MAKASLRWNWQLAREVQGDAPVSEAEIAEEIDAVRTKRACSE